jgi:hypothetical protein
MSTFTVVPGCGMHCRAEGVQGKIESNGAVFSIVPSRSEGSKPSPTRYGSAPGGKRNDTTWAAGLPTSIWARFNAYAPTPTNGPAPPTNSLVLM